MASPRHAVATSLALAAAGALAACSPGGAPAGDPGAEPAPLPELTVADSALIGEPVPPETRREITLVEPGAAPRSPIRYTPTAGARTRVQLRSASHITMALDETPFINQSFPADLTTYEAVVVAVESDALRLELTLTDAATEGDASGLGALGEGFESARRQLEVARSIRGSKAVATVALHGRVGDVAYEYPDGLGSIEVLQAEQTLRTMVSELIIAFPPEPIGVGARWQITDRIQASGLVMENQRELRLVRRDGDRIVIEGTLRTDSPPQMIGEAVEIESMSSSGTLHIELSLSHPTLERAEQIANMNARVKTPADSQNTTLVVRSTLTYRPAPAPRAAPPAP